MMAFSAWGLMAAKKCVADIAFSGESLDVLPELYGCFLLIIRRENENAIERAGIFH